MCDTINHRRSREAEVDRKESSFARGWLHGITGGGLFHRISYSPDSPDFLLDNELAQEFPAELAIFFRAEQRRQSVYAMTGRVTGGLQGTCLLAAFVFLVIKGHVGSSITLLGVGVLTMVAGFRLGRH
jgi:hypothetical protein